MWKRSLHCPPGPHFVWCGWIWVSPQAARLPLCIFAEQQFCISHFSPLPFPAETKNMTAGMLCSLLDQGKRESCPGMLLLQHACLCSGLTEWATLSSRRSDTSPALRFFHSPQLSSSNNKRKHWEGRRGRLLLPKMPAPSGHCILPTTWPLTYSLFLEEISLFFFPPHFFWSRTFFLTLFRGAPSRAPWLVST